MPAYKIENDKNSNQSTLLTKLKSNLWKCYQIRKRHYFLTIFIILLPVLSFAILGYARAVVGELQKNVVTRPTYNPIWTEDDLYETYKWDIESSVILYTPATNFTNTLMRRVQLRLDLLNHGIKSFPNEEDLLHHYFAAQPKICFAVIFHGLENDSIPTHLDYDIRFNDNNIRWKPNSLFQEDDKYSQGTGSENYFQSGFMLLQMAIDTNYISMQNQINLTLTMQEFPYPPYTEQSEAALSLFDILPAVTLLSFILVCPTTLKNIVEEKDSGIKELMKMMGLPTFVMWICWFIEAMILNTVSIIMIVLCMKVDFGANSGALEYCNPLVLGIFLLLYCSASTTFCFLLSTIINNPSFTTIIGIMIWMVTYMLASSLGVWLNVIPWEVQLISCIFPNFAMTYGYRIIEGYEHRDIGLQWMNITKPAADGINELAMSHIFIMLIVDIFLFMLFAIYTDSINPGKMGAGKPYYYPLTVVKDAIFEKHHRILENSAGESNSKIEECHSRAGVQILKLCKVYEKSVLHNFSIDFYEGEITALLGVNGAGKTTILSIISGMVPATSGIVEIAGYSLVDNLDYIRSMVGVCPQQNLLFNDLSVKNHLKFVAMLNGIEEADKKISILLATLKLYEQRHMLPNKLSGGMKRKLCLGMALIKNPKVLILDEPTSGLDTESRREIWNILNDLKNNVNFTTCSIIISTHYMDEAEQLGDRIAIVDHGACMAYGTPQFLKREYGTGTNLTVIKDQPSDKFYADIEGVIQGIYAQNIESTKKENSITYRLDHDTDKLLKAVQALEGFKREGVVDDIMITNTSVDDVLTCISKQVQSSKLDAELQETPDGSTDSGVSRSRPSSTNSTCSDQSKRDMGFGDIGWILFKTHLQFIKKSKKTYLLPALFCITVTMVLLIFTTPSYIQYMDQSNSMKIDLNWYGNTNVYCSASNTSENQKLLRQFGNITTTKLGKIMVVDSVSEALINEGKDNIEKYKQHAVVAAEFNSTEDEDIVNAMYSNLALHGAPISWNLVANAIVATYLGQEFYIKTQNKPLPVANKENLTRLSELRIAFLWMIFFPLGILVFTGSFIVYPHVQKKSNLLQLLQMAGVKKSVYWAELFIFDCTLYAIVCALILSLIQCCKNPIFLGPNEMSTISIILFLYGLITIPIVYLFSFFKSLPAAANYLQMYDFIGGVALVLAILILEHSGDSTYERIGHILRYISQLLPQNLLTFVMYDFCRKAVWNYNWSILDDDARIIKCKISPNPCCDKNNTLACAYFQSYSNLISGNSYQIMTGLCVLVILVLTIMLMLMFFQPFEKFCTSKTREKSASFFTGKNLTKRYNKKIAVKDLKFQVERGTCFGLLGVNGSGKTTAFKLLTGAVRADGGDAGIGSSWLSEEKMEYLSKIGYCPQVDALNEALTVREMLLLFGNIRGFVDVEKMVDNLIYDLGLSEYSSVLCGECSGGNKRKLSLGISLIVDPEVIMLDEPTCGVDPISRRCLWNYLAKLKVTLKKTMVLTSHSLAECEVLCDSVSILSKGRVLIIKTPVSTLKKNYGKIYTVEIKVNNKAEGAVDKVKNQFVNDFQSVEARLQSKHLCLLKFSVNGGTSIMHLLQKLEDFKKWYSDVEDYVISMPNLEEIFLYIIKKKDSNGSHISINM